MDSLLKLSVLSGTPFRILQLTDTHLFASKNGTLLGVNTWASYQAVLDAIEVKTAHCDLIIASGDLAQDHSSEAYRHFIEGVQRLSAPCVWLAGNHDFQPAMLAALTAAKLAAAKHVLIGEQWQLVLLDSQVVGEPYGELSGCQLDWLERALARYPQRHTLVALHHHPLPSGCSWLDQHRLRNSPMLDAVLKHYPLAKTLACGHIHQEFDAEWNGRRLLATPSTCVQFKPHSTHFTVDTKPPGWRWFELHEDGRLDTRVERLASREFAPDLKAGGY